MVLLKMCIKLFCREVGSDNLGNTYYVSRKGDRRFVVYNGIEETTKIPPMWHAWIHKMTDTLPDNSSLSHHTWQKPHVPNLTGTCYRRYPAGHVLSGSAAKGRDPYEPWKP